MKPLRTDQVCNHCIGFCQSIDNLVWKDDECKEDYLSDKCDTFDTLDVIFKFCPECGGDIIDRRMKLLD